METMRLVIVALVAAVLLSSLPAPARAEPTPPGVRAPYGSDVWLAYEPSTTLLKDSTANLVHGPTYDVGTYDARIQTRPPVLELSPAEMQYHRETVEQMNREQVNAVERDSDAIGHGPVYDVGIYDARIQTRPPVIELPPAEMQYHRETVEQMNRPQSAVRREVASMPPVLLQE